MNIDKRIEELRPAFNHDTYPSVSEGIKQLIRDVIEYVKPERRLTLEERGLPHYRDEEYWYNKGRNEVIDGIKAKQKELGLYNDQVTS